MKRAGFTAFVVLSGLVFCAAAGAMGTNSAIAEEDYSTEPAYIFFDGTKMYEKQDLNSAKFVAASAGTVLSRLRWTREKIEYGKRGLENWYEGVEPGGNTVYVKDSSLAQASFMADFDGDGKNELFLYGLDFETYKPGAKSGMIKVLKGGKTVTSINFEPMIYYDGERVPNYSGYEISASLISPKGFTPPLKLIKLEMHSKNESFPFGDAYFLWKAGELSHSFSVEQNWGPVHSLTCKAFFPVEKNGKANSVIIKESFEYGLEEAPGPGEGSYDRTMVYRWDGKGFRKVKDEKKYLKWVPNNPE